MRRMEEVQHLVLCTDPLLACCLCKRLLQDAVQLSCLHSCCRHCFTTAATIDSSQGFACGTCGTITQVGTEKPNYFIDCQVQKYASIAESGVCGVCKGNGEHDKPALVWCATCRHSLCGDCVAAHRQYFRQHVTQSLEELKSLEDVCGKPSASSCPSHNKQLDVACIHCEQAKCIRCWAECKEMKHEMHIVGEKPFDTYVDNFVAIISSMERDLLQKSKVLDKPKNILQDTHAARDRHLGEIKMRKQCIVDAVETAYQEIEFSTKNAYDDLEAEGGTAAAVADRISCSLSDARNYIRRLVESNNQCEILNQQKTVRQRLSALSAEMDSLSDRLATTAKEVKLDASLPEDLDKVVRAWIGMPVVISSASSSMSSAQQQQLLQKPVEKPRGQETVLEAHSVAYSVPSFTSIRDEIAVQACYDETPRLSYAVDCASEQLAPPSIKSVDKAICVPYFPLIFPGIPSVSQSPSGSVKSKKSERKVQSESVVNVSVDMADVVLRSDFRPPAHAAQRPALGSIVVSKFS